jgi:hypothetical protein
MRMTIVDAIRQIDSAPPASTVAIGSTDAILRCMFPEADAHVMAWRRHKWLQQHTPTLLNREARSRFLINALLGAAQ